MKNNLFIPGTKFIVVDPTQDGTFNVGSTGFISYLEKIDGSFMNVAQCRAAMTRRGKGGKNRLSFCKIFVPIFPVIDEGFAKAMPTGGIRKYYLHIEQEVPPYTDVMGFSSIDFIGWAHAKTRMLKYMSEKCKHRKWPEKKGHPFNQMVRMHEYYEEDPERWDEKFADSDLREAFITKLRPAQASLVRILLKQAVLRSEILNSAAEFLEFTNSGAFIPKDAKDTKNEYRFTEDDKALKENVKKTKEALKKITKLSTEKFKRS